MNRVFYMDAVWRQALSPIEWPRCVQLGRISKHLKDSSKHCSMAPGLTNTFDDVVIIGAGPAGIAAAIAARQVGFRTTVLDARVPPMDKPCGEGILPHGVAALRTLGVHLDASVAVPFVGIRFEDQESSVRAE